MKIGFYAPLKSPSHTKPSGDREIGRLFLKALKKLGHEVEVVSDLRSWDGHGSLESQRRIRSCALNEVSRLLEIYSTSTPPDLIFTYHVYHKAPDWIGIALAQALNIPYVLAEASFAPKQLNGLWHQGHMQSQHCIQQADRIIAINQADIECLQPLIKHDRVIELLKPFLDEDTILSETQSSRGSTDQIKGDHGDRVNLITVAMMRHGDKKASYKQLSDALRKIDNGSWRLTIIGDGDALMQVKEFFADLKSECLFMGELSHPVIYKHLLISDIFVWPAINEALGLALLEAQACGLPVIAQDYGGVSSIVDDAVSGYVTEANNIDEFVAALESVIKDKHKRACMSVAARQKFDSDHSLKVALSQLEAIFEQLEIR